MFKRNVTRKLAANGLILALGLLAVFHILILSGILPDNMVWGGRAQTVAQRLLVEIGALTVTLLMILMVAVHVDYIEAPRLKNFSPTAMWVIFVFLVLNTAGNLSSSVRLETFIFTPITIILAVFAYRLAMKD